MNNNYNSKNNSGKNFNKVDDNNNDNDDDDDDDNSNNNNYDNNNIKSLILANNFFFTSCLNLFKLMFLFIELGNLFQTEGPIYERLFCPMVVSRNGTLSLA